MTDDKKPDEVKGAGFAWKKGGEVLCTKNSETNDIAGMGVVSGDVGYGFYYAHGEGRTMQHVIDLKPIYNKKIKPYMEKTIDRVIKHI